MKTIEFMLVAALLGCVCTSAPAADRSYVTAAVADPARGEDAKADQRRHPAQLAVFAQLKPGDTVVDLVPGAGYFTRIFSRIVGPQGHVYAVWPNEYAKVDGDEVLLTKALAADPHYSNVTLLLQPAAAFAIPVKADVVWTSQNYHDYPDTFMGPTDPQLLDEAVFKALKPGGIFVVIDHVAEPGSGTRATELLHRVDPQMVKQQVTAAGFTLDGESDVLRNPTDDHKVLVFDPTIRGHTDQFVFRFRRPR